MLSRKFRAAIVDDEVLARRSIKTLMKHLPDWQIVGEGKNGLEAVNLIRKIQPDLVFMDIDMPKMNGIEALKSLKPKQLPYVIFLTAYDEYALQAFEVNAIDYLLKPYSDKRFFKSIEKAERILQKDSNHETNKQMLELLESFKEFDPPYRTKFSVKIGDTIRIIGLKEIWWFQASGPYVEIHTGSAKHLMNEAIGKLEKELDPKEFIRIHRSTIVRISKVKALQKYYNGEYLVIMENSHQLKLSRSYKQVVNILTGE